jgi:hypothetical protein
MLRSCLGEARLGRSGRVQHLQHAEMPLVLGIKGRKVLGRAQRELIDVHALFDRRHRNRGSDQHLGPNEAGGNGESRCEYDWLFLSRFRLPKLLRSNSPSADQGAGRED